MTQKDDDRARDQARLQAESIAAMVAALELDYDRLEELRELRDDFDPGESLGDNGEPITWAEQCPDEAEELRELEAAALGGEASPEYACKDHDEARQRIEEDALSVQVRSGWTDPGTEEFEPEEFEILLCTGGPAVRIRGELDGNGEPSRAWLEYQDWGTPWTEYHGEGCERETLLTYCRCFYFGRG